ncbi:MAG: hypothetical protein WBB02_09660 [Saprospiraceae bacterium]
MPYFNNSTSIKLLRILVPLIFWGIIILIYHFLGLEIVVKSFFNFLLGLIYAFGSFLCFYYYNKNLHYERNKDRFLEKISYTNMEQHELEQKRRDKFFEEYTEYSRQYHDSARILYFFQGLIAVALSLEFLCGWG